MRKIRWKQAITRSVPIWLVIGIFFVGLTSALIISNVVVEKMSIFTGQVIDSDFVVDGVKTIVQSESRMKLRVTIRNTDIVIHNANVTVQLLDINGDLIIIDGVEMTQNQLTGDVNGGGIKNLQYSFNGNGLVAEYQSYLIIIYQEG